MEPRRSSMSVPRQGRRPCRPASRNALLLSSRTARRQMSGPDWPSAQRTDRRGTGRAARRAPEQDRQRPRTEQARRRPPDGARGIRPSSAPRRSPAADHDSAGLRPHHDHGSCRRDGHAAAFAGVHRDLEVRGSKAVLGALVNVMIGIFLTAASWCWPNVVEITGFKCRPAGSGLFMHGTPSSGDAACSSGEEFVLPVELPSRTSEGAGQCMALPVMNTGWPPTS